MDFPLMFLGASYLLELLLYGSSALWRSVKLRSGLVCLILVAISSGSASYMAFQPNLASLLIVLISLYRIVNLLRIAENRLNPKALLQKTRLSSLFLGLAQLIVILSAKYITILSVESVAISLSVMAFLTALAMFITTRRNLIRTKPLGGAPKIPSSKLPSVSVLIPARNETEDLVKCLEAVVASDYPKLEILALDDCSQMKRTPEIIRSFAHSGVRFLQGDPPRDGWLAKNQAYDKLLQEASGELVLFIGVDIRLSPDSISQLVTDLIDKQKTMTSLLPLRSNVQWPKIALSQANRYLWELAPPRRYFNRPPVLSSCWLIYRQALIKAGGLKAVARSITPEAHFAKLLLDDDGYRFMRSNSQLGVRSIKSTADQFDTAVRVRYPSLHRRPEMVMLISLAMLGLLISPLAILLGWLLGGLSLPAFILGANLLAIVLAAATYSAISRATAVNSLLVGLTFYPLSATLDVFLMHLSMFKYEFAEVSWKDRNICVPVMRVTKQLPKI